MRLTNFQGKSKIRKKTFPILIEIRTPGKYLRKGITGLKRDNGESDRLENRLIEKLLKNFIKICDIFVMKIPERKMKNSMLFFLTQWNWRVKPERNLYESYFMKKDGEIKKILLSIMIEFML